MYTNYLTKFNLFVLLLRNHASRGMQILNFPKECNLDFPYTFTKKKTRLKPEVLLSKNYFMLPFK